MLDIDLQHYNEMVKYEPAMDRLRALALWVIESGQEIPIKGSYLGSWQEDVFLLIKHFSMMFAEDIDENGTVMKDTVSRFSDAIVTVERILGITKEDIQRAREQQLYKGSGFWEMRRFLGQFGDIAEGLSGNTPNHIVAAGISGCVVSEYLGLRLEKDYRINIGVDHMLFRRDGPLPVDGVLPRDFHLRGKKILLVEDAVQESRTLNVMTETLSRLDSGLEFTLFSLAIEYNEMTKEALAKMAKIYTFDE